MRRSDSESPATQHPLTMQGPHTVLHLICPPLSGALPNPPPEPNPHHYPTPSPPALPMQGMRGAPHRRRGLFVSAPHRGGRLSSRRDSAPSTSSRIRSEKMPELTAVHEQQLVRAQGAGSGSGGEKGREAIAEAKGAKAPRPPSASCL